MKDLVIAGKSFPSRLLLGTGKFASSALMSAAIAESGTAMVTVALKRVEMDNPQDDILSHIDTQKVSLLPNTSGVRNAKEAVFAAQLAREALGTNWLKLEIHPDPRYLMPDPIEVLKATEELAKDGFVIGSNKGLASRDFLRIIIEQSNVPVVVDAGIGAPSHAAEALEMGADAVLVNTAIAVAQDPVAMARAFRLAVEAGRTAFEAKLAPVSSAAHATSPIQPLLDDVLSLK